MKTWTPGASHFRQRTDPVGTHHIGQGIPFERVRRITGYLVGTLDRFNNAKRAEERERLTHPVNHYYAGHAPKRLAGKFRCGERLEAAV